MSIEDMFDYKNGIFYLESEKEKFYEKIERGYNSEIPRQIPAEEITVVDRFEIKMNEINLSVICVRCIWGEFFIYNKKNDYLKLKKRIADFNYWNQSGGPGFKLNDLHSSLLDKSEFGTEKHFWNDLFGLVAEDYDIYEEMKREIASQMMPVQINPYLEYSGIRRGIIIENQDFEKLYNNLLLLLPENIEEAKKLEFVNENIEKRKCIISTLGENFENKEKVLDEYAKSISEIDIVEEARVNKEEYEYWDTSVHKKMVEAEWGRKYLEILSKKKEIIELNYYNTVNDSIISKYDNISDKKIELLNQIRNIGFEDGVELYKIYQAAYRSLCRELENAPYKGKELLLYSYIEFYQLGCILISNQLNKINKNKSKTKKILQDDLDKALMYFYETNSPDEAEELRQKEDYLENKKNGLIGEKEVEYALKWLDKKYIVVPRNSIGKYGEKSIILYNPDFIDEQQEYDHIIIGPQGIFLIETKNYSGKLIIDANGNWIRIKKNGIEEGERNPIQQLRRHEKLLQSIINENIAVIGVLCMSHPKMVIEGVENCKVPLVKSDLLVEFIENYSTNQNPISEDKMEGCLKRIEKYMR